MDNATAGLKPDKARLGHAAGRYRVEAEAHLAAVTATPREHLAVVGKGDAVSAATGNLHDPKSLEVVDCFRPQLALAVAELAVVVAPERIHGAALGQHERVLVPACHAFDMAAPEKVECARLRQAVGPAVPKLPVAAVAPCTPRRS